MLNFIKGLFCLLKEHDPVIRYRGITVLGYKCRNCGYRWYEKRRRN